MKHAENEILELFISESSDLLKAWESFSLELERNQDPGIFDELFRIAHSLKGFGQNASLAEVSKLIHLIEEFVLGLRDQRIECDIQAVDILLDFKDVLSNWISEIRYDKNFIVEHRNLSLEISRQLDSASKPKPDLQYAGNILIVDRQDQFTQLVKCLLDFKYEVVLSHSNADALSALKKVKPVLVIVEIKTVNIDGLRIIQDIRQQSSVPIIAYSKLFTNEFAKAKAAGANATLQKDDNVSYITMTVEKLLEP